MSQGKKAGKKTIAVHKSPARGEAGARLLDMTKPGLTRVEAPGNSRRQEGRYVYGVIESRTHASFGHSSVGGGNEEVYTVHHGDLAAVVSHTPVFIFDPTRDNVLAHEHVVEAVLKNHTVIPMSFGTVFRTDDDVRAMLKSTCPTLKHVLEQMAGKHGGVCDNPKQIKADVDCRAARPKFDNGIWSPAKISDVTGGGLYLFVTPDQNRPGNAASKLWRIDQHKPETRR